MDIDKTIYPDKTKEEIEKSQTEAEDTPEDAEEHSKEIKEDDWYIPFISDLKNRPDKSNIHLDPDNFTGEDGRVHIKIR